MKGKLIALAVGALMMLGGLANAQGRGRGHDDNDSKHGGKHLTSHRRNRHDNGRHLGQYKERTYRIRHRGGTQYVTYYDRNGRRSSTQNRSNRRWGHDRRWTNPSHRSTRSGWTRVNGRWVRPSTKHPGYLFSTSHPERYSSNSRTRHRTRTRTRRPGYVYSNGNWVRMSSATNSRTGYVYSNGRWVHRSAVDLARMRQGRNRMRTRTYRTSSNRRNRTHTMVRHRLGLRH